MNLGERLIELRKASHLSQEEVAFKLNVTRQTVSKWETNQSTPDFDKIGPLCDLFEIDPNELVSGIKKEEVNNNDNNYSKEKRTKGVVIGILLYFVAVAWIIISVPYLMINPIASSAVFVLICGVATCMIIYTLSVYKKEEKKEKETKQNKLEKQIESIVSLLFTIIYLFISFTTMMWHITWIIWIIYALVIEIIKLILSFRGDNNE